MNDLCEVHILKCEPGILGMSDSANNKDPPGNRQVPVTGVMHRMNLMMFTPARQNGVVVFRWMRV